MRLSEEAEFKKLVFPKLDYISFFVMFQTASWAFHFILIVILKNNSNEIAESVRKIEREKQGAKIIHYYETVNYKHQTGHPSLQRQIESWKNFALLSPWFKIDWNAHTDGKAVRNCGLLIVHFFLLTQSFNGIPFRWGRKMVGFEPSCRGMSWDLDTGGNHFLVPLLKCRSWAEQICPSWWNQSISHIAYTV